MQISINDLESLIDPTILQRGKDYFRRGLVTDLEEVEEDRWSALVEGTETYEVAGRLIEHEYLRVHKINLPLPALLAALSVKPNSSDLNTFSDPFSFAILDGKRCPLL